MSTVTGPSTVPAPESVDAKKKTPKVKAEGEVKAAEGEAAEEKKQRVPRPRLPKLGDDQIITVLRPNAKTGKSAVRFNQYRTGMTIKEYVDLMTKEPHNRTVGEVWADIRWDTNPNRNLIHVGPTVVDVPPPPPPKEPKPKKAKKAEAADQSAPAPAA